MASMLAAYIVRDLLSQVLARPVASSYCMVLYLVFCGRRHYLCNCIRMETLMEGRLAVELRAVWRMCSEQIRHWRTRKATVVVAFSHSGGPCWSHRVACGNARRLRALRRSARHVPEGTCRPLGFETPRRGRTRKATFAVAFSHSGGPCGSRRVACGNARRLRALRRSARHVPEGTCRPLGFETPRRGRTRKATVAVAFSHSGGPCGSRTHDLGIKSPLLCQLS